MDRGIWRKGSEGGSEKERLGFGKFDGREERTLRWDCDSEGETLIIRVNGDAEQEIGRENVVLVVGERAGLWNLENLRDIE